MSPDQIAGLTALAPPRVFSPEMVRARARRERASIWLRKLMLETGRELERGKSAAQVCRVGY